MMSRGKSLITTDRRHLSLWGNYGRNVLQTVTEMICFARFCTLQLAQQSSVDTGGRYRMLLNRLSLGETPRVCLGCIYALSVYCLVALFRNDGTCALVHCKEANDE